jgi:hypothetical protein
MASPTALELSLSCDQVATAKKLPCTCQGHCYLFFLLHIIKINPESRSQRTEPSDLCSVLCTRKNQISSPLKKLVLFNGMAGTPWICDYSCFYRAPTAKAATSDKLSPPRVTVIEIFNLIASLMPLDQKVLFDLCLFLILGQGPSGVILGVETKRTFSQFGRGGI